MVRRSLIACMFVVLPLACDPNAGPGCTEGLPVLSETRLAVDAGGHAWDIEATGTAASSSRLCRLGRERVTMPTS